MILHPIGSVLEERRRELLLGQRSVADPADGFDLAYGFVWGGPGGAGDDEYGLPTLDGIGIGIGSGRGGGGDDYADGRGFGEGTYGDDTSWGGGCGEVDGEDLEVIE